MADRRCVLQTSRSRHHAAAFSLAYTAIIESTLIAAATGSA
jgi:hypothetical protein